MYYTRNIREVWLILKKARLGYTSKDVALVRVQNGASIDALFCFGKQSLILEKYN